MVLLVQTCSSQRLFSICVDFLAVAIEAVTCSLRQSRAFSMLSPMDHGWLLLPDVRGRTAACAFATLLRRKVFPEPMRNGVLVQFTLPCGGGRSERPMLAGRFS